MKVSYTASETDVALATAVLRGESMNVLSKKFKISAENIRQRMTVLAACYAPKVHEAATKNVATIDMRALRSMGGELLTGLRGGGAVNYDPGKLWFNKYATSNSTNPKGPRPLSGKEVSVTRKKSAAKKQKMNGFTPGLWATSAAALAADGQTVETWLTWVESTNKDSAIGTMIAQMLQSNPEVMSTYTDWAFKAERITDEAVKHVAGFLQ